MIGTRDLLLVIGFLRSGKMFPSAVPLRALPDQRSLKVVLDSLADQEIQLFGKPSRPGDPDDVRRRAAMTAWSGDPLAIATRVGEVPDPGVLLCLLYDVPAAEALVPAEVFAQTLRRYALRDPVLHARFEQHLAEAGTFVPPWLSPELARQRSQESFDRAMKVAREQGFAAAAPLFEGVRGDCFAPAQVAVALYEQRELGDVDSALARLSEVVRMSPRNVAARMQRANVLARDPGRQVEAAGDYLAVLREMARPDAAAGSDEVRDAALAGLWDLHQEFADPAQLDAAIALARQEPERGFEALSRYVHTHPCAWDAQKHLASLALARQRFDLTIKLLATGRWVFTDDPNPHFVYGQALAAKGANPQAVQALEHAARIAPLDADIAKWLAFTRRKLVSEDDDEGPAPSVDMSHHVARSLLLLVGFVRLGKVIPMGVVLHKIPGDVSLALVLQALAGHEQRRFGGEPLPATPSGEVDLRSVSERTVLMDHAGERLSADQTAGDVADPGIVLAFLYEPPGSGIPAPSPAECRRMLTEMTLSDADLAGKVERHLASADATIMKRLDLA